MDDWNCYYCYCCGCCSLCHRYCYLCWCAGCREVSLPSGDVPEESGVSWPRMLSVPHQHLCCFLFRRPQQLSRGHSTSSSSRHDQTPRLTCSRVLSPAPDALRQEL